jgi:large conductance mechanosensitive channel
MTIAQEFKKFVLRGNMIDLAVGFTVGAAFTTIAKSLVDDLLMPPIGLMLGDSDFSDYFIVLREGAAVAAPYATLADARAAGAVTLNYGMFGTHLLTFAVVAVAMFVVIRMVNKADARLEARFGKEAAVEGEPADKKCPYCLATIPFRATRCGHCTSQLEEAV